jgi:hypothetical protein
VLEITSSFRICLKTAGLYPYLKSYKKPKKQKWGGMIFSFGAITFQDIVQNGRFKADSKI